MSDDQRPYPRAADLAQIVSSAAFVPSSRQIRARTAYYAAVGSDTECPSGEAAVASGAPQSVIRWWSTPGFSDWWNSPQWEQEESQALLLQAMSRVSEILRNEEMPATVIAAAREAREIWTKLNITKEEKFADAAVAEMDRKQLEEYIRRNTAVISTK